MKKRVVYTILAVALAGAGVRAEAQQNHLIGSVPFRFHIGERILPAGFYDVRSNGVTLVIRSQDDNSSQCIALVHNAVSRGGEARPRLIFTRYGDQFFLRSVWGNSETGQELPVSKAEKTLVSQLRQTDSPEQVVLALKQ